MVVRGQEAMGKRKARDGLIYRTWRLVCTVVSCGQLRAHKSAKVSLRKFSHLRRSSRSHICGWLTQTGPFVRASHGCNPVS